MPRNAWERAVRALFPVHFFLCRECGTRGTYYGASRGHDSAERLPARPLEQRDYDQKRMRHRRGIASLVLATLLGAAMGLYVHSCRSQAEIQPPVSE